IAGTLNAHPVATMPAIAALKKLASPHFMVYEHVENQGVVLEEGLKEILGRFGQPFYVARESSAFCVYFMEHAPQDFHDILSHHNFALDRKYRLGLIENGIFNFPLPIKQGSISFSHSMADIEETLDKTSHVAKAIMNKKLSVQSK